MNKKNKELQDASNLDDEIDAIGPGHYYEDEVPEQCQRHAEIRGSYYRHHYGNCIYCILDGEKWDEEWDSWGEVAIRAVALFKIGFEDYKRGIVYPCKRLLNTNQEDFVKIYKDGQKLARSESAV